MPTCSILSRISPNFNHYLLVFGPNIERGAAPGVPASGVSYTVVLPAAYADDHGVSKPPKSAGKIGFHSGVGLRATSERATSFALFGIPR